MELWDLLDAQGNPLGKTHPRSQPVPVGAYHRTVDIFTVNSRGELLVTLRSPDKDTYPDFWETTGGSVLAGETSLAAAVRELREETGLVASPSELRLLARDRGRTTLREVYLLRRDASLDELTMQEGETVAARWVSFERWERMIADGMVAAPLAEMYLRVLRDILPAALQESRI